MPANASNTLPNAGLESAEQALRPLIAVCVAFIVLETVFVVLRFISRMLVKKTELGWDDWLLIPAYLINMGLCALGLTMAYYESIGNPPARAPIAAPQQLETQLFPVLKIIFAIELMITPGYTLPKLSVLCLYLRIFEIRWMRVCTFTLISLLCIITVIWTLASILQCHPVNYFWDRLIPGACIDIDAFYRSFNPPNIATDVLILALPLPSVWRLHATLLKKIGVSIIFLAGSIGLIASCVRFSYFLRYTSEVIVPYTTAPLIAWTIVEPGMYLIAACSPALKPILEIITPGSMASWFGALSSKALPSSTFAYSGRKTSTADRSRFFRGEDANFSRLGHLEQGINRARVATSLSTDSALPLRDINKPQTRIWTDSILPGRSQSGSPEPE